MKLKIIYLFLAVCVMFLPVFNEPKADNTHEHTHKYCEHEHNNTNNKNDSEKECLVCIKIELSKIANSNIRFLSIISYPVIPFLQSTDTVIKYSELFTIGLSPIELKVRFNT